MAITLGPAKGKDTATSLGPVAVSVGELVPYLRDSLYELEMRVCLGDTEIGSASLANMTGPSPRVADAGASRRPHRLRHIRRRVPRHALEVERRTYPECLSPSATPSGCRSRASAKSTT